MNINRTIIVPAAHAQLARDIAVNLNWAGVGMFETPLYTGAIMTHYVSSGWIDAAFGVVLIDVNALYAACQSVQVLSYVTLAQCQELIAQSIVVDCDLESAQETFARLGMTL